MCGIMKVPFQYALGGAAAATRIRSADAFLAPSPTPLPLPSSPHRSLISSWLTGVDRENGRPESQNSIQIETQTLYAPLESFEKTQANHRTHQQQQQRGVAAEETGPAAGLWCLERPIPEEVLRGLGRFVDDTAPFMVEALRAGGSRGIDNNHDYDEGWLDTLTAGINTLGGSYASANTGGEFGLDRQHYLPPNDGSEERRRLGNSGRRSNVSRTSTQQQKGSVASDQNLDLMQHQQLEIEPQESVRWLKADIKRVANLFAREVSVILAAAVSSSGQGTVGAAGKEQVMEEEEEEEEEDCAADVTVKLELLKKGKCPRFHLDKVPIRLICTYVGPSTEWLDGYDKREMENNRISPPACNLKISGGRQTRQARPGDVLIFRGQPEGSGLLEGGALGVAHRSPDMVEGQRRLVLTIDAGDITSTPASPPGS